MFYQNLINIIDNNYVIYPLVISTTTFIAYLVIKSYFTNTVIETSTPIETPSYDFSTEDLGRIQDLMERGESNQETPPTLIQETPNSQLNLNFSPEEMHDIRVRVERGEQLDPQTQTRLDQDLQTIMGVENYNAMQADLQVINDQFTRALEDIFSNLL